jgi:hypothetical protein
MMFKALIIAGICALTLAGGAQAAQPLSDAQMDQVTAGDVAGSLSSTSSPLPINVITVNQAGDVLIVNQWITVNITQNTERVSWAYLY